jgi:hypothetical protein
MIYNYKGWTNKSGVTFIADTQEFGIDGWHFVGKKWFNTNDPINLVVKTFVGGEPAKVEKYQFPEIKLDNLTIDHTISYFNHVINGKFDLDKNQRENRIINLRSLFDVLNEEEVKAFAAQKMNPYEDDPDSTILGKLVVGKKNSSRPEVYRSIGEALSDASSHLSLFKRSAYKKLIKELIQ